MDGQIHADAPSLEQMARMIRGFLHGGIKEERGNNCLPHFAAVIFFLHAPCHSCASPLTFRESAYLNATTMGKRCSSVAGAAAAVVKKAKTKTADADAPAVGNWV
jgi:hypothetical protein